MAAEKLKHARIGDHVLLLTLNRPDKRNAVDADLSASLAAAVEASEADPTVRAVVLAAEGERAFCAGADFDEIAAGRGFAIAAGPGGLGGLVFAERGKPWIAAVGGVAAGGGFELALACDLIVAGETARFLLPEVSRGLIPGAGGAYRLVRRLPPPLALELLLTGQPIGADRALRLGLVNRVVANEEVVPQALALAATLAGLAPLAVRETLRIARQALDRSDGELRAMTDDANARLTASEDLHEGVRAFREKRPPQWRGR